MSRSGQSAKRFRGASQTAVTPKFFVDLPEVASVCAKPLRINIQQKFRDLCGWTCRGFPGTHPVRMHGGNYKMILESPYMVTWKLVCKRYMMLIEKKDKVYMLDHGDNVFTIDNIQFPRDAKCTEHLKDTLVDGELVIDNADGTDKPTFLISDIITYNGEKVSTKPLSYRLMLISELIVNIRNNAIANGHIQKTTQPFSIRSKEFFDFSELDKLLSPQFAETIHHQADGLIFVPKNDPYTSGECPSLLKWKENVTIEFLLKIVGDSSQVDALSKNEAHLFLNGMNKTFATMRYSPDLREYDNKIISCLYKDGEWVFYRLRDDRPYPNSQKSAKGSIEALKRSVTREALIDLIKNQSENHVHDDDLSSTT